MFWKVVPVLSQRHWEKLKCSQGCLRASWSCVTALAFLILNERKYLSLFFASLVWLISAPWNGAERQHWCEEGTWISRSPECTFTTVNTEFAAVFFFKCHYRNGQKLLLSSFPVWFFFLHVMVENRNWKSQVYVSWERNPQWWVCTPALIGPIDLLGCIYNCLEIVNRCWSPA